jgi:hypothetical protein
LLRTENSLSSIEVISREKQLYRGQSTSGIDHHIIADGKLDIWGRVISQTCSFKLDFVHLLIVTSPGWGLILSFAWPGYSASGLPAPALDWHFAPVTTASQ